MAFNFCEYLSSCKALVLYRETKSINVSCSLLFHLFFWCNLPYMIELTLLLFSLYLEFILCDVNEYLHNGHSAEDSVLVHIHVKEQLDILRSNDGFC